MPPDTHVGTTSPDGQGPDAGAAPRPDLPEAARRALAEAADRRAAASRTDPAPPERGGRGGLDPVRYHDWEIGGRAIDF